jgi:DNA-directed RNA polymerase subunit RPC12/RpoP
MVVICPFCGNINKVKMKRLDPTLEIACRKCGARQILEIGITSQAAAMVECPLCGHRQIRAYKCVKCGAGLRAKPAIRGEMKHEEEGKQNILSKRYKMLTITAVAMIILIILGTIAGVFFMLKRSDAYRISETFIRSNDEIKKTVGENIRFGLIPVGSVKLAGRAGMANFKIRVKGSKGSTVVRVYLRRSQGTWRVASALYTDKFGIKRRVEPSPEVPRSKRK